MQLLPTATKAPASAIHFSVFEFHRSIKLDVYASVHAFKKAPDNYNQCFHKYKPDVSDSSFKQVMVVKTAHSNILNFFLGQGLASYLQLNGSDIQQYPQACLGSGFCSLSTEANAMLCLSCTCKWLALVVSFSNIQKLLYLGCSPISHCYGWQLLSEEKEDRHLHHYRRRRRHHG